MLRFSKVYYRTWTKIKIITWLKRITFIIQQNQINFIQINYVIYQNKIQYTGRRILKDDDVGIQSEKKNWKSKVYTDFIGSNL